MYADAYDERFPSQRKLYLEDGRFITAEELLLCFMKGALGYSRQPIERQIHELFNMLPAS